MKVRAALMVAGMVFGGGLGAAQAAKAVSARKPADSDAAARERTESGEVAGFKICAVGDTGSGDAIQKRVADAMQRFGCKEILLLGDNFYDSGVRSTSDPQWTAKFREPYARILGQGAVFHPVLGNHDYNGVPQAQVDYSGQFSQWAMPAKYYSFRLADGAFCGYALDSVMMTAAQAQWLSAQLRQDTCAWKVAYGHYPLVSSGYHGSTGGEFDRRLRPALDGADVYLSGHEHSFADEGTHVAYPSNPRSTSFRQIVVGTGGANSYPVRQHTTPDLKYTEEAYGFLAFEVTPRKLKWTFYNTSLVARYSAELTK